MERYMLSSIRALTEEEQLCVIFKQLNQKGGLPRFLPLSMGLPKPCCLLVKSVKHLQYIKGFAFERVNLLFHTHYTNLSFPVLLSTRQHVSEAPPSIVYGKNCH